MQPGSITDSTSASSFAALVCHSLLGFHVCFPSKNKQSTGCSLLRRLGRGGLWGGGGEFQRSTPKPPIATEDIHQLLGKDVLFRFGQLPGAEAAWLGAVWGEKGVADTKAPLSLDNFLLVSLESRPNQTQIGGCPLFS